jgi:diketogulonate reductase-like aldo/keto reductase
MDYQTIAFGTYRLTSDTLPNALNNALLTGYRGIDTASLYNNQKIIGDFLSENQINRNQIWITSKLPPKIISKSENEIIENIIKTMSDLQTKYLDLFLLHSPVKEQNIKAWAVIEGFQRQGYFKNIGVSNYDIDDLKEIQNFSTTSIFTNQLEISPFLIRSKVIEYMKNYDIKITAHSSLAKGEKFDNVILQDIARKYSRTPAQIMLKWAIQNKFHIIPRSSKYEHINEDIQLDFIIGDEDMNSLNDLNIGYTTHPQYKFAN